jgi:hypothetical protein
MLELVMAVSEGRRLPDWALGEGADAEVLETGIWAVLLACTGAMTHHKLERLRTLRRRRASAREEETGPKQASKRRRVGRPPKKRTAAVMTYDLS